MRIIFQPKIFLTLAQCWMQFYYTQRIFIAVNVRRDAMMRNRPFSLLLHFSMFWWKCNSCKRTPATHTVWRMCTNICMQPFEGDKLSRGLKVLFRHKICVCVYVCGCACFTFLVKWPNWRFTARNRWFSMHKNMPERCSFTGIPFVLRYVHWPVTAHIESIQQRWHIPAGHTFVWFAFANKLQDYS